MGDACCRKKRGREVSLVWRITGRRGDGGSLAGKGVEGVRVCLTEG